MHHPEWFLVHGVVNMVDGTRMGHAWNERQGWAYDHVLDLALPVSEFGRKFNAAEWLRLPGGRPVAARMLEHGHWGPWVKTDAAM
jgi:hypothetical protein